MKYLSKEELVNIADELLKNPTGETLKKLSDKYSQGVVTDKVVEMSPSEITIPTENNIPVNNNVINNNMGVMSNATSETTIPTLEVPTVESNNMSNLNNNPQVGNTFLANSSVNNNINGGGSSLEVPIMGSNNMQNQFAPSISPDVNLSNLNSADFSTPTSNNPANEPIVNSSINPAVPTLEMPAVRVPSQNNTPVSFSGNLWEPQTPNINNLMETTDNFNTNINVGSNMNAGGQFFGSTQEQVNNPIPVSDGPSMGVQSGPSMFSQMQDSYKAA